MDAKRRDRQRANPGQKPVRREVSEQTKGFAGLDPAKLGLEGPEWLVPPSPLTAKPAQPTGWPDAAPPAPLQQPGDGAPAATVPPARTLLEGMKVVCICKGIKQSVFWKVLDTGARSKEEINRLTGSGSGGCQGRRCGPRIMDMLRELLP